MNEYKIMLVDDEPDIDGYEVCKQIREFSHSPILFLSSKNDELDLDAFSVRAILYAFLTVIILPFAGLGFKKHQVA